jgi:MYXO-CTERM domain-containing protein
MENGRLAPSKDTMSSKLTPLLVGVAAGMICWRSAGAAPISLDTTNPHYLAFRGKPTVLVTSGEHYGAVLNLDFDYVPYLDELKARGLNLTRTWSGVYVEDPSSFGIEKNTLAPKSGRYIGPWARSGQPGYAGGGNKFDLSMFDDAYFARLKDFVSKASDRGIVVEFGLFCAFYEDKQWNLSPMKGTNNVNGVGNVDRTTAMTLNSDGLLAFQDGYLRKIAAELATFDNVYYEIANEPYDGVADAFQDHVIATMHDAESGLADKHLLARNYCNDHCTVSPVPANVSVFNFHYAHPPSAVGLNYAANRVLSYDETGFEGTGDDVYRKEAWAFLLAGGAIFDNLDYSFSIDNESGDFKPSTSPGGGSLALRTSLGAVRRFMEQLALERMKPDTSFIKKGAPDPTYALAEPGREYAAYLEGGTQVTLTLDLPADTYYVQWIDPKSVSVIRSEMFEHAGGTHDLSSPAYAAGELALLIKSKAQLDAEAVADAGVPDATGSDAGLVGIADDAAPQNSDATVAQEPEGSSGPDPSSSAGIAGNTPAGSTPSDGGCSCRTAPPRAGGAYVFAGVIAACAAVARRRRRRDWISCSRCALRRQLHRRSRYRPPGLGPTSETPRGACSRWARAKSRRPW